MGDGRRTSLSSSASGLAGACGRRSERRRVAVIAPLLVLVVLQLGASCRTPSPAVPPRALGGLLIACEPADALIYVDDRLQGSVDSLKRQPLLVPEGFHRLELRRDGYFSHFAEVTVAKGVQQRLEVKLRKEPY